jgi:hypothetical protein
MIKMIKKLVNLMSPDHVFVEVEEKFKYNFVSYSRNQPCWSYFTLLWILKGKDKIRGHDII